MRRSERTQATRAAIVEAAAVCFAARGFDGCSIDEVAAEAGVTKPTVYAHFGSKEGLCEALVEGWWAAVAVDNPLRFRPGVDVGAQLLAYAQRHLDLVLGDQTLGLIRAVSAELIRRPDWAVEVLGRLPEGELPAFLREAHAAGALTVPDPKRGADLFLGAMKGCLFYPRLLGLAPARPAAARDAVLADIVAMFVAAHGPRGDGPAQRGATWK